MTYRLQITLGIFIYNLEIAMFWEIIKDIKKKELWMI